jgi:hypothetical protein
VLPRRVPAQRPLLLPSAPGFVVGSHEAVLCPLRAPETPLLTPPGDHQQPTVDSSSDTGRESERHTPSRRPASLVAKNRRLPDRTSFPESLRSPAPWRPSTPSPHHRVRIAAGTPGHVSRRHASGFVAGFDGLVVELRSREPPKHHVFPRWHPIDAPVEALLLYGAVPVHVRQGEGPRN